MLALPNDATIDGINAFPASRAIPGTVTTVDSALIVHEYRLCAIMTML